jgi:hypothetical protein
MIVHARRTGEPKASIDTAKSAAGGPFGRERNKKGHGSPVRRTTMTSILNVTVSRPVFPVGASDDIGKSARLP